MFDDAAFREAIKNFKIKAVAAAMNMTTSTLYRKRRGESDFTRSEIQLFVNFTGASADAIFFAKKVS